MSIEQPNLVINGGLSDEQMATAIQLKSNYDRAGVELNNQIERANDKENRMGSFAYDTNGKTHVDLIGDIVVVASRLRTGLRQHNLNKTKREAGRHYHKDEAAYQEQALREATEVGVDVIKGWAKTI